MKKVPILDIHQFHDHDDVEEFYANTLQDHIETRHKDIALPHKHNFYLAVLFTQGSGVHEVDFTSYPVRPGALFFLNPGQTHHWELSSDVEGYIFFHSQAFYDMHFNHRHITGYPFFYSMHNSPIVQLDEIALSEIKSLFKQLLGEQQQNRLLKQEKLLSLVELIYIESTRIYTVQHDSRSSSESPYSNKFRQLDDLVEKHFREEKSPAHYASLMNMSPKHLNRITQAVSGKTTSDVILDRVLLEAKKELLLQRQSFAEIAYSLGYDDYAYFSRLFKKRVGETPSVFLSRYRKR
jgi:AraC-like DNA-binding protein